MKTHDAPKRSPGEPGDLGIHGRPAPYQTGVLPKDFVQRLNRLKKASGLTWNGFARALRVDRKQMPRWRSGRRIQEALGIEDLHQISILEDRDENP